MIINGITLPDIDVTDADVAESYESALEVIRNNTKYAQADNRSVVIRKCCNGVFEAFDMIFGSGTAKELFGDRANLTVCLTAVDELVTQVNEIEAAGIKRLNDIRRKYTNYNQQRSTGKKNKNKRYYNNKKR